MYPHLLLKSTLHDSSMCRCELTDQVILPNDSHICAVLSKVEAPQFIQTYVRAEEGGNCGALPPLDMKNFPVKSIVFELPRLCLEFLLQGEVSGQCTGQMQRPPARPGM